MRRTERRAIAIITVALALGACAGGDPDEAPEVDAESSRDRALLDAAQQPLDRARGVQDIAAGRKGDLDAQINEAE
jgi:hypothetical protein